jgi:hypothetical protein
MTTSEITSNISATFAAMEIMMKRADKIGMTGEEFVKALKGRESEFAKLVESCKNYLEAK